MIAPGENNWASHTLKNVRMNNNNLSCTEMVDRFSFVLL